MKLLATVKELDATRARLRQLQESYAQERAAHVETKKELEALRLIEDGNIIARLETSMVGALNKHLQEEKAAHAETREKLAEAIQIKSGWKSCLDSLVAEYGSSNVEIDSQIYQGETYPADAVGMILHRIQREVEALRKDKARLDWMEEHLDSADKSGYGADDYWWKLLYNDGNRLEGATLREAIDRAAFPKESTK